MLRSARAACLWLILALTLLACRSDRAHCRRDSDCDQFAYCYQNECVSDEQSMPGGEEPLEPSRPRPSQTAPNSCLLLSCSSSSFDAGTSGGRDAAVAATPTRGRLVNLDLRASGVVADSRRKRLYVTLTGTAPNYPNQVVTVDARTAKVIHGVPIGSDPRELAISDDGSTLWVHLAGAFALRRLDLSNGLPVAGEQYPLPADVRSTSFASLHIVALPGSPNSVVIASGSPGGLMVFDNGVLRPPPPAMMNRTYSALIEGPAGYLVGLSGLELMTIAIRGNELVASAHRGLLMGTYELALTYGGGYLFTSSGEVVDLTRPDAPHRAGRFPMPGSVLRTADPETVLLFGNRSFPSSQGTTVGGVFIPQPSFGAVPALEVANVRTFTAADPRPVAGAMVGYTQPVRKVAQVDATTAGILFGQSYDERNTLYLLTDIDQGYTVDGGVATASGAEAGPPVARTDASVAEVGMMDVARLDGGL